MAPAAWLVQPRTATRSAPVGIRERLGWPARSWALVTKTVVVVVQMGFGVPRIAGARRIWELNNRDSQLWLYDKATGEMLAEIPMPQNATGSPATYMLAAS